MEPEKLSDLSAGHSGLIKKLEVAESLRRRLLDLGLTYGTEVACVRHGFGRQISAYTIRGATIAIRKSDADNIFIIHS